MDSLFEKFKKIKAEVRLDAHKKKAVREHLVHFMNTMRAEGAVSEVERTAKRSYGVFNIFFNKSMSVAALVAIMVLIGGGVSFAAQRSLPGDILYPVKVGFNEKVVAAFKISPVAKVDYEVDLANRRLEEAARLAVRGDVSAQANTDLMAQFQEHADNAKAQIQHIEGQGNVSTAADAASRFEGSLKTHNEIFEKLEIRDSKIKNIKAEVSSTLGDIVGIRLDLESKVEASDAPDSKNENRVAKFSAQKKLTDALKEIDSSRSYIKNKKSKLGSAVTMHSEAKLNAAHGFVVEGDSKVDAKSYGEAFNLGNEAIRAAQEAKSSADANLDLHLDLENENTSSVNSSDSEKIESTSTSSSTRESDRSRDENDDQEGEGLRIKIGF